MTNKKIDPEYLGQVLLKQGFETWMRYMFRVLEGRPFIIDPIHPDLFKTFQKIHDLDSTRQIINLPPRSGKTVMSRYFVAYSLTKTPECNFIYTSYSQELLAQISKELTAILEHPAYKAMYPNKVKSIEDEELNPIDDYWREYLIQETGKNKYSARKISTYAGGVILFSSIGASITGFGCGIRGVKKRFTGCLIIDDPNKPGDVRSMTMRQKVVEYYTGTLLNRLNESCVPILVIQQRLNVEDLTGFLIKKYNFNVLRKPLIEADGQCLIPSQYTPERIEELKVDENSWLSQFQQTPIAERGQIIKRDWWKWYNRDAKTIENIEMEPVKGLLIITADTAYKETAGADYSAIGVWELGIGFMKMRELLVGKWEFPDLIENAKMIWEKWHNPNKTPQYHARYFFIEDKASGISLVQTLEREGINAEAWKPKEYDYPEDKVGRMKEASLDVHKGMIYLPTGDKMAEYLVNEAALFSKDMSHSHDDACDCFTMAHSIWRYNGGCG